MGGGYKSLYFDTIKHSIFELGTCIFIMAPVMSYFKFDAKVILSNDIITDHINLIMTKIIFNYTK